MFCILHKWFISRSMDTSKPLPRLVARHASRCPACARFRQQCVSLARRLNDEARREVPVVSPELHEKILHRCSKKSLAGLPAQRLRLRRPAVALAAAAAIVLLAVGGVYLYSWFRAPPQNAPVRGPDSIEPPAWLVTTEPLSAGAATASVIENALRESMEEEIRLLRRDGEAAAEFLLACIPLDLDPRGQESSPPTQPGPNGG